MAEIQKQNSGLRSNFKQFELQHLVSTETESHAVKNWCQFLKSREKVAPMPHIFYTNTSHSVKTLTFRCVKEMSQGRRFFYAPKRVFYIKKFLNWYLNPFTIHRWVTRCETGLDLTKCIMFLLIRLCGAQADLRLRWSHTTKSGYIHLQTCGKESKF